MIIFMSIYMHLLLMWVSVGGGYVQLGTSSIAVIYFGYMSNSILLEFGNTCQAFYSCSKAEIAIKPLEKERRFLMTLVLIGLLKEMCCRENTMNQVYLWICLAYNKHFKCLMNFLTHFVQGGFSENAGTSYSRIWNLTLVVISIIH